jgi:hypothetical protein
MKRFWLVLLSLGLVMAFSASAFAVDVKFSGEFYVAGLYMDKTTAVKGNNESTAFYFQRLRLKTEFVVSPGLSLITRANILERAWGAARSNSATSGVNAMAYPSSGILPGSTESAGTPLENENIAFDWAYIHYVSPTGIWDVGYQLDGPWGTKFGDSDYANPRVFWILPLGNTGFMLAAGVVKLQDNSFTAKNPVTTTDLDADKYAVGFAYQAKNIEGGLLLGYWRYAGKRATTFVPGYPGVLSTGGVLNVYGGIPYIKAKFGPVDLEAEIWYVTGDMTYEDKTLGVLKIDNNILAYVDATVNLGMFYFGGMVVYASGDNPDTTDKIEGGIFGTGKNLEPTLIMFSNVRYQWVGPLMGNGGTGSTFQMNNGYIFQGRFGVKPTDKFDILAKVTYAMAATASLGGAQPATANLVDKSYGTEVDVMATYKITNNLSYMLGAGYLFTGGYYKGQSNANLIQDDYLLINKLTLTF